MEAPPLGEGKVPAGEILLSLPLTPPYPPMEALLVNEIPEGAVWEYEPKWDGFRCLAFKDGDSVELQSKAGQPLARYFPEVVAAVAALAPSRFVLDGEIAIPVKKVFSFDDLLQRIHPAESRVKKLSKELPAILIVFDLLVDEKGKSLAGETLEVRRRKLEEFARRHFGKKGSIRLSPATMDRAVAQKWLRGSGGALDGIIAKRLDFAYRSGDRTGMRSGISAAEKKALTPKLEQLIKPPGFTGRAPGGPSRWSTERTGEWEPLAPKLVVEIRYDHFTGGRFRHGTKLLRWRPDKPPKQCTLDQVDQRGAASPLDLLH